MTVASKESMDSDLHNSKSGTLTDMTEHEMSQHLSLCLKLAAENKINPKNAFDLHLIRIMRDKVKDGVNDLQYASLSLQAGTKIYAGRVEALYKDIFALHNQLQTIKSNKKVTEDQEQVVDGECGDEDEERKEKRRTAKSRQTYITNEDNVSVKSESTYQNAMPHANFITIKSAFTASRTAPKLLGSLTMSSDACKLSGTVSVRFCNPLAPAPVVDFPFMKKNIGLLRKIQNTRLNSEELDLGTTSSDVFFAASPNIPTVPPEDALSDDSFSICASPPGREQPDAAVEEIIEKFSVLDITADLLANDLSLAIVDGNTMDRRLLPPNSALRKVLKSGEKSKVNKTPKPRREKAPREPFFNSERVVDESIATKGRKIELLDHDISQFKLKDTTHQSYKSYKKFLELTEHSDENDANSISKTTLKLVGKLMKEDILLSADAYFSKELQLWNQYGRQTNTCLLRPSSFGICLRNEESSEMLNAPEDSNCVVQSFQNLSLQNSPAQDSPARSDDYDLGFPPDVDNIEDSFAPVTPTSNRLSRSGLYEDDLKSIMVNAPELVQPINVKFQTEPITLNTEKVKSAIWNVVEKDDDVLLTDLHKNLKNVFKGEKLPLQYAFAMLLLLSNEKCLLLENTSNGADIKITKDISEI